MQLDRADMLAGLQAKGFRRREGRKNEDHDFLVFEADGLTRPIYTKLSRGSSFKTYGAPLLALVKKQLYLDSAQQLGDLVLCPMSLEEYEGVLYGKGLLPKPEPSSEG